MNIPRCLLDSNILLRTLDPASDTHAVIRTLSSRGVALFYTSQNLAEFWSVCTRPITSNGYGLDIEATENNARKLEEAFTLLPDNEETHRMWRRLVFKHRVHGRQVHDARLVAAMLVHSVSHILTMDVADFRRFTQVSVLHPSEFDVTWAPPN